MEIDIYNNNNYKDVTITIDNAVYKLGLLDKQETKQLAQVFLEGAQELIKDL